MYLVLRYDEDDGFRVIPFNDKEDAVECFNAEFLKICKRYEPSGQIESYQKWIEFKISALKELDFDVSAYDYRWIESVRCVEAVDGHTYYHR